MNRSRVTDDSLPITGYPKVSIIILNWNGLEDTIECLESLKKITYPNYDVIVVDNGSEGNDVEVLKERYSDYIHIIADGKNYGYPEGNNIGMRYALSKGANYALLLNNDTIVDPVFLTELVKTAQSHPSMGLTGSKIYYYSRPTRIQGTGGKIRWWLGDIETYGEQEDQGQYDEVAVRDFVFGTSLLVKKEAIEKIGFMDSYFFFGVEEFDYCTRAKRAGFEVVYVPTSKVWHKAGASRAKLPQHPETLNKIKRKAGFLKSKYYYRLFRKHCPRPWFIFPFLAHTMLQISMIRLFFQLLRRGDWQMIKEGLRKRTSLPYP